MNLTGLESPGLYHVGWIAALPLERTAALLMLDEKHKAPANFEQGSNDTNSYTWGRVGEHNVVIASLQAGVYGTVSAAVTAQNMLSSFPNIRIGLFVGIGAGVARPDKDRDIRLGDVVVSQPSGTNGGVIQYDLVKARGNHFVRKGFLNGPPALLLSTVANIQAEHGIPGQTRVPEILEGVLRDHPELLEEEEGFFYQGSENDNLFKSTYKHVNGSDCTGCSSNEKVERSPRRSRSPKIHYGTIASGDILMKDAIFRDWVIEQLQLEDCLCFEMEAAGLMNNFPCLVIRGICDYGDSHKNDRWQQYAAAAAAAYAKEFLRYIPGRDMERAERATDVMERTPQESGNIPSISEFQTRSGGFSPQLEITSSQAVLQSMRPLQIAAAIYLNRKSDNSQVAAANSQLCEEITRLVQQLQHNQNNTSITGTMCCAACCPKDEYGDNKHESMKQGRAILSQEDPKCSKPQEFLSCKKGVERFK